MDGQRWMRVLEEEDRLCTEDLERVFRGIVTLADLLAGHDPSDYHPDTMAGLAELILEKADEGRRRLEEWRTTLRAAHAGRDGSVVPFRG